MLLSWNLVLQNVNLPGFRWATLHSLAPVRLSSPLHSEACDALGASDGVIHSRMSPERVCSETLVGEVSLPVTLSTSWRLDPPEVGEEPVRKGMYKTGSRHDQPGDAMYRPFMYIKIFKRPHLLELVNVRATKDFAETLVGEVSLPVTLSTSWRLDPPEVGEEPVRKGMCQTA